MPVFDGWQDGEHSQVKPADARRAAYKAADPEQFREHPEAEDLHHHMRASDDGMPMPKEPEDHQAQAAVEQRPISPIAEQVDAMRAKYDALMAELAAAPPKVPEQTSIPEKMQELAERELPQVLSTQQVWDAATQDEIARVALEAAAELRRGIAKHGVGVQWPTNSARHEAYAVLLEEIDELWDEVKARVFSRTAARQEAIQVAAMAIRFVINICDTEIER